MGGNKIWKERGTMIANFPFKTTDLCQAWVNETNKGEDSKRMIGINEQVTMGERK